jgi:Rieske 2Fe-2S family protein
VSGRPWEAAPVDRLQVEAALQPFGHSRMLPRKAYVDEAVFQWEMRTFFAGGWICVGRGGDVPEPGDQAAVTLGRGGVLLTRDMGGRVHAFANTCRHRGHELLQCGQTAHREIVLCPYHNWSYRLDGSLRRAPHYNEVEGFDKADFGLVELPAAEWHGLLFVDASGDSGPFAGHVEGLDELLAPYELQRLKVAAGHDYVVNSNWKLLVENPSVLTRHTSLLDSRCPSSSDGGRERSAGSHLCEAQF